MVDTGTSDRCTGEVVTEFIVSWSIRASTVYLSDRRYANSSLAFHVALALGSQFIISGQSGPRQIGLARLITDGVSFGYLTDVYVLPEYQGKGLGRWLMACLSDVTNAWPHLRRVMLVTSGSRLDLYKKTLGVEDWNDRKQQSLVIGLIDGPAAFHGSSA